MPGPSADGRDAPPAPGPWRDEGPGPDRAPGPDAGQGVGEEERLARAALTRLVEPGDETVGRWLRELGPVALLRALCGEGKPPPGASGQRMAGCALRADRLDPAADLAMIAGCGGRFVCPGDLEWPGQLDDLKDARPVGLWVRGPARLRMWALRSVAVVGARACSDYGSHVAATLGAGLAERGWVVVSGAAGVLYLVTVVVEARCHPCGGVGIECPVLAAS